MSLFDEIIGHEQVIAHLQNSVEKRQVSHCYIFHGEDGIGKRMLAKAFAQMLLCEHTDTASGQEAVQAPCDGCTACLQVRHENHPDLRFVTHEKPNTFGVDDVRDGLNRDIVIKPYRGPYKIYILDDAQLLNVQAQNAILKTIEEPPEYAVILLLTNNKEIFLETILSRSVVVDLKPLPRKQVADYMEQHYEASEQRQFAINYARGNIGQAVRLMEQENYRQMVQAVIEVLKKICGMPMEQLIDTLRTLTEYKEEAVTCLNLILLWYRDVSLYRMTGEKEFLNFPEEADALRRAAEYYSLPQLGKIFDELERTFARLRANVNFELALEILLLECSFEKKKS